MSEKFSETGIVKEVARRAAARITRTAIAELRQQKYTLSGDDSALKTTWDEICVQVQHEESYAWPTYVEVMQTIIENLVDELPAHEQGAIWLQSPPGDDWRWEEPDERDSNPVRKHEIVHYLLHQHLLEKAERWTNKRIRRFLEKQFE